MSTYSCPESLAIACMISSVMVRSSGPSACWPWYREKSSGSPNRTPGRTRVFGQSVPGGWNWKVLIMAHGITGAPDSTASRAAGAFGVDAEHMTFCQHAQAGLDRLLARHSPAPVQRNLADAGEEGLAEQTLDPAPREVLR